MTKLEQPPNHSPFADLAKQMITGESKRLRSLSDATALYYAIRRQKCKATRERQPDGTYKVWKLEKIA